MSARVHHGDLVIQTKADVARYADLEEVTGYLYISAEGAGLAALTTVGGSLDIRAEGAGLAALTTVGGSLYISAEGAGLAALTTVGGSLYISAEGAGLAALTTVGGYPATLPPIVITEHQWLINILDTHMTIGCQKHSLDAWAAFSPREIAAMEGREGAKFWGQHGQKLLDRARAEGRVFAQPLGVAA